MGGNYSGKKFRIPNRAPNCERVSLFTRIRVGVETSLKVVGSAGSTLKKNPLENNAKTIKLSDIGGSPFYGNKFRLNLWLKRPKILCSYMGAIPKCEHKEPILNAKNPADLQHIYNLDFEVLHTE